MSLPQATTLSAQTRCSTTTIIFQGKFYDLKMSFNYRKKEASLSREVTAIL